MSKNPTVAEAQAALAAAETERAQAEEVFKSARTRIGDAQVAVNRAKRAVTEARERERVNATARARNKAKKLAAQYGVTIEREDYGDHHGVWWVLGPDGVYGGGYDAEDAPAKGFRADPCHGDHTCGSWDEVLNNVEEYVRDIEALGAEVAKTLLATA